MVWMYSHDVCLRSVSVVERWEVLHAAFWERIAVVTMVRACPQDGLSRLQRAGGISIFKYRFRNTVAADEVIRLVVKKKELAERQESNLPDTDGL